jgi:ATP synthase protein I
MTGKPLPSDGWSAMGVGWEISATILGGIAAWGLAGYLVDRLAGTTHVFLPVGMVIGAAGAIYLVYLRHGRGDGGEGRT